MLGGCRSTDFYRRICEESWDELREGMVADKRKLFQRRGIGITFDLAG